MCDVFYDVKKKKKKNWTGTAKTFTLLQKKEVANENTFSGVILLSLSVLCSERSQVDPA